MSQWEIAVRQLGEQMGVSGLRLNDRGRFSIVLDSDRRVAGEISADELLIYAYDSASYDAEKRLLRAWRQAYMNLYEGRAIQTALFEQNSQLFVLAVVRLGADECSAYTMRSAIDVVSRWLDNTCMH